MAANEEWTTSRCNRLLRPISSKLAKLRSEIERPRSAGAEPRSYSSAFATKCSPHKTTNFTRPSQRPRGFDKTTDPDWRPDTKAGRGNKRTYGGRGARKTVGMHRAAAEVGRVSRPGEIAFTPLVARIGGPLHSSPHVQNSPLKKYGKNRGPLQVNIDWTQLPGDVRKLVQGVCEAYANALQATTDGNERSWKGTRSLMGACLRRLPAYIELEDYFAKLDKETEDEEQERDVAAEVYEHLETQFEHNLGQGWRPFKQVVRAHATSLLCDAVSDEVIGLDSLSMLVTHCVRASAWDEAERLLIAYLPLLESLSLPVNTKSDLFDGRKQPYLHAVKSFVDHTGRHRLLFDLLEHMVAHELLPLEWLATECMRPMWDRLVRSISNSDHRTSAHAVRFFETVTTAGMGLPDQRLLADEMAGARTFVPSTRQDLRTALNTTYSSLFTVLCSIALVNKGRDDETGRDIARRVTCILDAVVVAIVTRDDIRSEFRLLEATPEDGQTFLQRALWAIFASLAVHLDDSHPVEEATSVSMDVPELIQSMSWTASQYASPDINTTTVLCSLPPLLAAIAKGTGRIWKDDGFDQLQRLVQALMSLSGHKMPHKLWTLKRLALESAMEFAQDTGMAEHFAYTREIEKKMHTQGRLVIFSSPQKNESPSTGGGFKWEEGIGEWVACTPFIKLGARRLVSKPLPMLELLPTPSQSGDDSDNDEVFQSSPIKRQSSNSLGKRQRAVSPMVVVSPKRRAMSPPDTPIHFYPELPEDQTDIVDTSDNAPRRSRRSRNELQALTSRLRTERSRTSLGSGLRSQERRTYADVAEYDEAISEDSDNSQDSSSPSSVTEIAPRTRSRPKAAPPRVDSDDCQEATSVSSALEIAPRKRGRPARRTHSQAVTQYDEADERDDLGITPARPSISRRASSRAARKPWWKVGGGIVVDSEGSEDELSFH
jgi:hypothetical protein